MTGVRIAALALLLGACDKLFGVDPVPVVDARQFFDAPIDGPPVCVSYGMNGSGSPAGLFQLCVLEQQPDITISGAFSTDEATGVCDQRVLQSDNSTRVCVRIGGNVTITNATVTGSLPYVVIGTKSVVISTLDVSSHAVARGAGSLMATNCEGDPRVSGASTGNGGGGGAGGGFGTTGGNGGAGVMGQLNVGLAQPSSNLPALNIVRAGCPGGNGGVGSLSSVPGAGGAGGGAVYIISGATITVQPSTKINASGAGGGGGAGVSMIPVGSGGGGGGGGGAGGLIALDAPQVILDNAVLFANGGGGGGGGSENSMANVSNGAPGADPMNVPPALGGVGGQTMGGSGGNGYGGGTAAMVGASSNAGGGGGGGAGVIVVYSPNASKVGTTSSPPLS